METNSKLFAELLNLETRVEAEGQVFEVFGPMHLTELMKLAEFNRFYSRDHQLAFDSVAKEACIARRNVLVFQASTSSVLTLIWMREPPRRHLVPGLRT